MNNRRRLIRLDAGDFLQLQPLNEVGKRVKGQVKDFSLIGICFTSQMQWQKGQVLLIDYFIPQEMDSALLKVVVVWSEFISQEQGYFCGGEVMEIEESKQQKFAQYYYNKLKERLID